MKKLIRDFFQGSFKFTWVILFFMTTSDSFAKDVLPHGFVYLKDIDASIVQDMRYSGSNNFIGRPIAGYDAAQCIISLPAAQALSKIQTALKKQQLSLKVFDCYRPQMAVDDFIAWSKNPDDQKMKTDYYPHIDKSELFSRGYIAVKSGHTRGSTTDLTIISTETGKELDMGTHFDFMDPLSHHDVKKISETAYQHRLLLKHIMMKNGFEPYFAEWWHYTLKNEPYPDTYFNFKIA